MAKVNNSVSPPKFVTTKMRPKNATGVDKPACQGYTYRMATQLPTSKNSRGPGQLIISRKDRLGALLLALLVLLYVLVSMPTGAPATYSARIDSMERKINISNYKSNYNKYDSPTTLRQRPYPHIYEKKKISTPLPLPQKILKEPTSNPTNHRGQHRQKPVSLQEADSTDLEKLPGIGPVLASRIVRYREKIGGFHSKKQLREVYGISDTLYRFLEPFLEMSLGEAKLKKIDLNSATLETLRQHPYLGWEKARIIVRYREANGPFRSLSDLNKIRVLDSVTLERFLPYATLDPLE